MNRRHLALVAAGLGALLVVVYAAVLLGGRTFALRDHLVYTLPARSFLRDALLAGRFPEWWDGLALGTPFAANPVYQAFGPIAWLCALLPFPLGVDVEPIVYLFVAGLGTALLAHRLGADALGAFVAGALVETSGYLSSILVNGNLPCVAWVPWVAWGADRLAVATVPGAWRRSARAAALLAVLGALQLMDPEPGATVTAGLLAAAIVLLRGRSPLRGIGWLAAAGTGAFALAAFTVVPALVLGQSSLRHAGLTLQQAGVWSMHPLRLLEWLWPHLLGDAIHLERNLAYAAVWEGTGEPTWSFSLFLGLPAILLAIAGAPDRRSRWLLASSLAFVVLALGIHTPVFEAFRVAFPPERYVRYPEKHVLGALVIVSAFAGAGTTRLLSSRPSRAALLAFSVGAALLGLAVVGMFLARESLATAALASARAARVALDVESALAITLREGAIAAAAAGVAAASLAAVARGASRAGAALLVVAVVGLAAYEASTVQGLVPRTIVERRPSMLAAAAASSRLPRVFRDTVVPPWNIGVEGYARWATDTAASNAWERFGAQVLRGMNPAESDALYTFFGGSLGRLDFQDLAALLGIRWFLWDERGAPAPFPERVVARDWNFALLDLAPVRPRAFVAKAWSFSSATESLRALASAGPRRDPGYVVLEGAGPAGIRQVADEARPCLLDWDRPERLELVCASPTAGYAVLLDEWAPGWTATVDGRETPVLRADGLFRAVEVGPGAHRIVFEYRTPGLRVGLAISALTALALVAIAWAGRAPATGRAPGRRPEPTDP